MKNQIYDDVGVNMVIDMQSVRDFSIGYFFAIDMASLRDFSITLFSLLLICRPYGTFRLVYFFAIDNAVPMGL